MQQTLSRRLGAFASTAALLCAAPLSALPDPGPAITLHFDPVRTEIHYTAGSALHRLHGTFALKGGLLAFDPATGVAQGQILVDAASGHSDGNKDRKLDAKMQNEVLESQKYPELFFHPEKSVGTLKQGSEQQLTLIGSFNAHGADHPLKVDTFITLHGDQATARAEFDVPYVEWGMKDESTMLMRDKRVHISMQAHATVEGLK
ncbi:MAG TPA: YceI family protein [Acidobacteriaceae bacterium]